MVKRILPCDVLGIVIETCCASLRAERYLPRFTISVDDDDVLNCCCVVDESVVDVDDVGEDVVDDVDDDVVDASVVVVANVVVVASVVVVAETFKVPTVTADV